MLLPTRAPCIHATASEYTNVAALIEKITTAFFVGVCWRSFLDDPPWMQATSDKHGVQPPFF
jgi:hypothetical protein